MQTRERKQVETRTCAIRLPMPLLDYLKRLARRRAMEENVDVTYGDLVREACSKMFPLEEEIQG